MHKMRPHDVFYQFSLYECAVYKALDLCGVPSSFSHLPPALMLNLLFDASNNARIVISDPFRFVWVARVFTQKRVTRKEIVPEIDSCITPRFFAHSKTVE
jgi:hypothetical protein